MLNARNASVVLGTTFVVRSVRPGITIASLVYNIQDDCPTRETKAKLNKNGIYSMKFSFNVFAKNIVKFNFLYILYRNIKYDNIKDHTYVFINIESLSLGRCDFAHAGNNIKIHCP